MATEKAAPSCEQAMRYSTTKAINLEAHIARNRELIAKTHQSSSPRPPRR